MSFAPRSRQLSSHLVVLLLAVGASSVGVHAAKDGYETPPALQASEILPAEALTGEHFNVVSEVVNDGIMNHYAVTSEFGEFAAYGNLELAKLIHQIDAIAEVEEVSMSDQFSMRWGTSPPTNSTRSRLLASTPSRWSRHCPRVS